MGEGSNFEGKMKIVNNADCELHNHNHNHNYSTTKPQYTLLSNVSRKEGLFFINNRPGVAEDVLQTLL